MSTIQLRYGGTSLSFDYDEGGFDILGKTHEMPPLTDIELGERLDNPIHSRPLEEIVGPSDTVLFVVPDATRQVASGQVINLIIRRLIANGTASFNIGIIFATGIHRAVTPDEKNDILTPFIAQRIKMFDHGPRDLMQIVRVGETSTGITVELNRALTEYDHIVLIGGVTFHYFAGFTGGRKLICPGLASAKTVSATHKLAFDCEAKTRREGVGTGLLDGNAVHEAFVEAASFVRSSFCVNTIVNDAGDAVEMFCGDWIESHRTACAAYASGSDIEIGERRDLVVVSCGGFPYDVNMIQAHKALEAASHACTDGGTIVLLAECSEGMGRTDFIDWFSAANSEELAERLCKSYQVNGQTAWSLLRKTENFRVKILTDLATEEVNKLRMEKLDPIAVQKEMKSGTKGYILPFGARTRILTKS